MSMTISSQALFGPLMGIINIRKNFVKTFCDFFSSKAACEGCWPEVIFELWFLRLALPALTSLASVQYGPLRYSISVII